MNGKLDCVRGQRYMLMKYQERTLLIIIVSRTCQCLLSIVVCDIVYSSKISVEHNSHTLADQHKDCYALLEEVDMSYRFHYFVGGITDKIWLLCVRFHQLALSFTDLELFKCTGYANLYATVAYFSCLIVQEGLSIQYFTY